jgi:hypothetical protein
MMGERLTLISSRTKVLIAMSGFLPVGMLWMYLIDPPSRMWPDHWNLHPDWSIRIFFTLGVVGAAGVVLSLLADFFLSWRKLRR